MALIAQVLIDGPSELRCDYAVPEPLLLEAVVGRRVRILLRQRRGYGTIVSLRHAEDATVISRQGKKVTLIPIQALVEDQPVLPPQLMSLAQWVSDYYVVPLEHVMRSVLPSTVRQENLSFKRRKILLLARTPTEDDLAPLEKKSPRQADVLRVLMASPQPPFLSEFPADAAKALVKKNWITLDLVKAERDPEAGLSYEPSTPPALSPEQQSCVDHLLPLISTIDPDKPAPAPILLHGVTGSGKTEIYLRSVQAALDAGRRVLVLVPEISLTPQTIERFKARFSPHGHSLAILHSHLSDGERHDEWHRIAQGRVSMVIGARSAIFAPLTDLGLIIVDEEHETSYKQDTTPRYHARDLAVVRAHYEKCPVILGSATPSLESWHNVQRGKYTLLQMTQRITHAQLPVIRVIDMKLEKRREKSGPAILSEPLRLALRQRLDRQEQAILFLNRRGYATSLRCPDCAHVVTCPHCSVSLVLHQHLDRLSCHLCGYQSLPFRSCPQCSSPVITLAGFGTERVEEALRRHLPTARIARVDADVMGRQNRLRDILSAFKAHQLDILIGTQMIAKGLDFPGVTLVGILAADLSLHLPDFRSGERTFQLLTQVAGRAGRGHRPGEVLIQTYSPHHQAIQFSRHGDYAGFAAHELAHRHTFSFPPFNHAALLTTRSRHERLAEFTLQNLQHRLKQILPDDTAVTVGDISPSPLARSEDYYRYQLLLRARTTSAITRPLRATLEKFSIPSDVQLLIDVDPYSLG
jgi:primosomal protein N' (replication factor Y) (superfamily II helicase)